MRSNRRRFKGHILPELGVALAILAAVALVLAALIGRADAAKQCAGDSDCPRGYSCRDATDGRSYCYPDDPPDAPPKKPSGRKQKRICDADRCGGKYLCVPFPAVFCDKCCWVDDD